MTSLRARLLPLPVLILLAWAPGGAQESPKAANAGAFLTERPTLNSLGFEWRINGDDNRNAAVDVTYRIVGEKSWRKALPLFRMNGEKVSGPKPHFGDRSYYTFTAPNMFAGSILNLAPDTAYEARFVLSDADGVRGKNEVTVAARTRSVPVAARGGHVYHVYPFGYKGPMEQP